MKTTHSIRINLWLFCGGLVMASPCLLLAGEGDEKIHKEDIEELIDEATTVAQQWAERLREYKTGTAQPTAYMGIVIEPVPEVLRDYIDLPDDVGMLLPKIARDGPAAKAGLLDNDIIVSFDGEDISTLSQLSKLIEDKGAGASVPVTVLRKGQEISVEIILGEKMRKGGHFLNPESLELDDLPDLPGMENIGAIMESVEEWIPGSVRIYVDKDEEVHVDLNDLKEGLEDLRLKLGYVKTLEGDPPAIIKEHGDHGARTTLIRIADKDITYESPQGRLELDSFSGGRKVTVWDPEGALIYEGLLPDNYGEVLPAEAVRMIQSLEALDLDTDDDQLEIQLDTGELDTVN